MKKHRLSMLASKDDKKLHVLGEYIKAHSKSFIVLSVTFFVLLIVTFFDVATKETVASFALSEYSVGQIADKTITADKDLPATEFDPVFVAKDEKIIRKGFPITEEAYAKLRKIAESPIYIDFRAFSNGFVYLFLLALFAYFLYSPYMLSRKIAPKEMVLTAFLYVVIYACATYMDKIPVFSSQFALPIAIPSVFCIIITTILFGTTGSAYFSFLISVGIFFTTGYQPVPSIFILAISITTTRVVRKVEKRIDLIFCSLLLSVLSVVFLFALSVIVNNGEGFKWTYLFGTALNAFLSGILALGFITPVESALNTASVFRLMDLADVNNSLMKKMLITAPGTYNHALMVATLAESACNEIGANSLLARVGAYYHDIGKIDQPEFFVENQHGVNKHDEINPRLSASVIKSHVKKGVERANQLRFPPEVVAIISEHHGNGLISYFYNEAKQENETISPEEFSYQGPLPSSSESAVVMLADTVEAACRTLKDPSVPRLEKFIHTLVMSKVENHQLDNSPLRFNDLEKIEKSFVNILAGYYHSRIEYPDQKDPDNNKNSAGSQNDNSKGDVKN
ncbi:MAG: HD family phosphohydrolase [Treponemataceae bacterium]